MFLNEFTIFIGNYQIFGALSTKNCKPGKIKIAVQGFEPELSAKFTYGFQRFVRI